MHPALQDAELRRIGAAGAPDTAMRYADMHSVRSKRARTSSSGMPTIGASASLDAHWRSAVRCAAEAERAAASAAAPSTCGARMKVLHCDNRNREAPSSSWLVRSKQREAQVHMQTLCMAGQRQNT